jgi:hypothetical protein
VTAPGTVVNTSSPIITGMAEPGSTVTISLDGTMAGIAIANRMGLWAIIPALALNEGGHQLIATATDVAGNVSSFSGGRSVVVDTVPPSAPVVSTASRSKDNRPTYSGTAEAGSTVTVLVDGTVVGTIVVANATGEWVFDQPAEVVDGIHTVRARATDPGGNTGPDSNSSTFTVDTTEPAAPVVTTPANRAKTHDNRPNYSGTTEAGSTVTVFVDGTEVGATNADDSGKWNLQQPTELPLGNHDVMAFATDAMDNSSELSEVHSFTIMQRSHYGWSCATAPSLSAIWALLALALLLCRQHRA